MHFRKKGPMYNNAFLGKPKDVVLYISPFCLQRLLNRTENKNSTVRTTTLKKSFDNIMQLPLAIKKRKKTKHIFYSSK